MTEDFFLSYIILQVCICIVFIACLYYRQLIFCLLCVIVWSNIWITASMYSQTQIEKKMNIVDRYTGLYNSYEWEVLELERKADFYDEYIVQVWQINSTDIPYSISHKIRIPKNFKLHPGQRISYTGKLYQIEDFDDVSYKKYMLSRAVYFSVQSNKVDIISDHRFWWKYQFFILRQQLLWRIENIFPESEAIFLGWILLGARENIPNDLKEDFNNSGLTHFIAVSGFNITLCIIFVIFLFWFLPRVWRIILVTCSIIIFSIFVWLGAPVVRAAIMWILWYMFLSSGAKAKNITLLWFTAVVMTFFSPLSLSYDVSLHLSFLAVVGIIYTQDFFMKICSRVPKVFAIREALVLTLAALSFALPIMIFDFGQVSLLAPFANIAVTWTIPIAMLLWALTLIVDMLSPLIWQYMGFIAWIFLHYDIMMVRLFWNIDAWLLVFDFWVYKNYVKALYFIILIYILALYQNKKRP